MVILEAYHDLTPAAAAATASSAAAAKRGKQMQMLSNRL
jgi:hypothetical protein